MNLNDQQKNIVFNSIGKVAVVAGAGAGKSTTNIELIAKLNKENNISYGVIYLDDCSLS